MTIVHLVFTLCLILEVYAFLSLIDTIISSHKHEIILCFQLPNICNTAPIQSKSQRSLSEIEESKYLLQRLCPLKMVTQLLIKHMAGQV